MRVAASPRHAAVLIALFALAAALTAPMSVDAAESPSAASPGAQMNPIPDGCATPRV